MTSSPPRGRRPTPPDVVGIAEVATLAAVPKPTVTTWLTRGTDHIPEPTRLACGPVWTRSVITAWLDRTGRLANSVTNH